MTGFEGFSLSLLIHLCSVLGESAHYSVFGVGVGLVEFYSKGVERTTQIKELGSQSSLQGNDSNNRKLFYETPSFSYFQNS